IWSADISEGTTYVVTAGEKTVTVTRLSPNTITVQKDVDMSDFIKFTDKFKRFEAPIQSPFCSPIPIGVSFPNNFSVGLKLERVGKYKSPDYGTKKEFSVEAPVIGVSGCAPFLPCCGAVVSVPFGGHAVIFPYVRFASGISLTGSTAKDPSSSNEDWDGTVTLAGKLELGAGVAVDVSFTAFGIAGGAESFTKFEASTRLQENKLEHQETWGGLQAQFGGIIYFGSPADPTWAIKAGLGPFNLIDGAQTPWATLVDLSD
ncbi:MAG: hypothetical protein KA166_07135, partial [Saprospiraceae bacterium]|nr:hypothetical protein [Saprospiraceae bacterium]